MIINYILNKVRQLKFYYLNGEYVTIGQLVQKVVNLHGRLKTYECVGTGSQEVEFTAHEISKRFQELYDHLGICRNTVPAEPAKVQLEKCPKKKANS